jgi:subtilisin family serine protease
MNVTSPSCFCDAVVAVIDTGVDFYHSDLMVNTVRSIDCLTIEAGTAVCKPGGNDDNGHGTHVAGTIGAINSLSGVVGVCPGAEIWSLKVLNVNGTGFKSSVLAAVDYVAKYNDTIDVANLSLGAVGTSSCDSTYCSAITKANNAGVAFSVSAGNSNTTVDFASPACCADVLSKCLINNYGLILSWKDTYN